MGSCAAPSAKGDDKFITTDYLQQCPSAELSVLPRSHNHPDDNTDLLIAIAGEVHWTLEEVEQYFVDYDLVGSDDGHPYYYLATFSDETPDELKRIAGLNSSNQLHMGLNIVPDEDQGEFE
ncbi:hypothetical protein [Salmonella enterica]|uniref:hypothetical protein n=1 Tax=Salmonella enterica TaxID=28901 RepID=UPI001CC4C172|nr:hypothetical protein [Salmonella enterica]MBZ5936954.1 hypothetical protein [Salmonella enterica subsp. enterica serovar Kentucky]